MSYSENLLETLQECPFTDNTHIHILNEQVSPVIWMEHMPIVMGMPGIVRDVL